MLFLSLIFFIFGIYLQVCFSFPLYLILFSFLPFFFLKKEKIFLLLAFASFFLLGALRIETQRMKFEEIKIRETKAIYEAIVKDVAKNLVTLEIKKPEDLEGLKVIFRKEALSLKERLRIYGELKNLEPTFQNPSILNYRYLKRLEGIIFELKGEILKREEETGLIERLRAFLDRKIEGSPVKRKDILKAITIGERLSIDEKTRELFLRTGTSHILSISGTHLSTITAFFFFLSKIFIRKRRKIALKGDEKIYAALFTMPFVFFYMLISGGSIPTIRATIMAEIFLFSFLIERERDIWNTIAISAFLILFLYPHSLFSPSFQLTFLSLFFIVLFIKKIEFRPKGKILNFLFLSFLSSLSSFLGSLPSLLYHFYGVNPLSFLHNLFAVPLICGISLPLAFFGLFLPFGNFFLFLSGKIIELSLFLLNLFDYGYIFPFFRPNLFETFLYYGFLLSLLFLRGRILRSAILFLLILSFLSLSNLIKERLRNDFCVDFLDVGNGLSILVEGEEGFRMLIDGGGPKFEGFDVGRKVILPFLLYKKILTIDYMVNTHPHEDHINGLFFLLEHLKVKKLAISAFLEEEENQRRLLEIAKKRKTEVEIWKGGKRMSLKGLTIEVLSPHSPDPDLNNMSLVLRLSSYGISFLIPSDIKREIEEKLVMERAPLKANVLLVPHHGSAHSSSMAFLLAVRPNLAILSVGKGIRGLPSEQTFERYRILQIPILSTRDHGFIKVCIRKGKLYYSTFN